MQPLLQSAVQFPPGAEIKAEQKHVLHAVVSAAPLLLEKGDAAWAATVLISAFHMALREDAGAALNDAALLQLGASDCKDPRPETIETGARSSKRWMKSCA
jgi:hypothetical protein